MAEENLKDFTINWIVTGLLLVALIGFAVTFMAHNNPTLGLDNYAEDVFSATYSDMSGYVSDSPEDANVVLNITSKTNPEISDLGSRDSVASAYSSKESSIQYWEGSKQLLGLVFSGEIGGMLIAVIGGILGFLSFYYIVKFIRNGI